MGAHGTLCKHRLRYTSSFLAFQKPEIQKLPYSKCWHLHEEMLTILRAKQSGAQREPQLELPLVTPL